MQRLRVVRIVETTALYWALSVPQCVLFGAIAGGFVASSERKQRKAGGVPCAVCKEQAAGAAGYQTVGA
mgnify:CR=1 FL=1